MYLAWTVYFTCPTDDTTIIQTGQMVSHCQVCGGKVSILGDVDPRPGHIEVQISWGPNSFDGVINELGVGILGYAVYAVDDCGEKEGGVLANVDSLDVGPTETCCELEMYGATITSVLGAGVTQQAYMVPSVAKLNEKIKIEMENENQK